MGDEYYSFKSGCCDGQNDCLLGLLYKQKGRDNPACVMMIQHLVNWCLEDEVIAEYVFNAPASTLRHTRYTDGLLVYAEEIKAEVLEKVARMKGRVEMSEKD